jgi:arabinose-5-phosphate isomerase
MLNRAKKIFQIEGNAILSLMERLDENFIKAVDIIFSCEGKVIVTGIGKSGLISQKIASTFACSGTPAFFLHSTEGIHGDIGMVSKNDVVIAVSNSGETDELIKILPIIKRLGLKLIVLTGNMDSVLAKNGDVIIDVGVREEACSMGLVPTASTAVTMAMGDALAITVLERRGFNEEDFAVLHPGGTLGKKLLLRVEDLMHAGDAIPLVLEDDLMKVVLIEMTSKRLGIAGVCDNEGTLMGIITDGDLRRGLEKRPDLLLTKAKQVMTTSPKTIEKSSLAAVALQVMEQHAITALFVTSDKFSQKVEGVIHLHDILKAGLI